MPLDRDLRVALANSSADEAMLALLPIARDTAQTARSFAVESRALALRLAAYGSVPHPTLRVMEVAFWHRDLHAIGEQASSNLEVAKFIRDCLVMVKACMQYLGEAKRSSIDARREFDAKRLHRDMPQRIGTLAQRELTQMPTRFALGTIRKDYSRDRLQSMCMEFVETAVNDVRLITRDALTIVTLASTVRQQLDSDRALARIRIVAA